MTAGEGALKWEGVGRCSDCGVPEQRGPLLVPHSLGGRENEGGEGDGGRTLR